MIPRLVWTSFHLHVLLLQSVPTPCQLHSSASIAKSSQAARKCHTAQAADKVSNLLVDGLQQQNVRPAHLFSLGGPAWHAPASEGRIRRQQVPQQCSVRARKFRSATALIPAANCKLSPPAGLSWQMFTFVSQSPLDE